MHIILGLMLVLTGCSAAPTKTYTNFSQLNPADSAAPITPTHEVTTAEITTSPSIERTIPQAKIDPGATLLIEKLVGVFDSEDERDTSEIVISTWHLRNQSRAQADEFDAMTMRLADLLDQAGRAQELRFTSDAAQPVMYHLTGTAYLVTADGFDQWELYLSLRPADRSWTLWQADAPVRLLRYMRTRGQQLYWLQSR